MTFLYLARTKRRRVHPRLHHHGIRYFSCQSRTVRQQEIPLYQKDFQGGRCQAASFPIQGEHKKKVKTKFLISESNIEVHYTLCQDESSTVDIKQYQYQFLFSSHTLRRRSAHYFIYSVFLMFLRCLV
jgi:hypothetical protein